MNGSALSLRSVKTRDSGVDHNLGVGRNDSKGKRRRFREAEGEPDERMKAKDKRT